MTKSDWQHRLTEVEADLNRSLASRHPSRDKDAEALRSYISWIKLRTASSRDAPPVSKDCF